ncbi:hypothetical protein NDU88_006330 [Pleurodeles waltl]|uniref:Secreted protein n=1 Tax=Pleurodeles waltl TaxID=8319 RepID=A0AAV7LNT0_PLEWA|nr:hypothetical protein NDU88_006330 [Pleurodeles waltl]
MVTMTMRMMMALRTKKTTARLQERPQPEKKYFLLAAESKCGFNRTTSPYRRSTGRRRLNPAKLHVLLNGTSRSQRLVTCRQIDAVLPE